ncbi:Protein CBR-RAM-5 [Caenorhabditis briggsae]|uniref:Protein CBR-RAM-5 n=1 Tax=Caenorhabditis briggsae TaxID=6238 RepID=A8X4L0_CAEBR|nr:Protein CBR-RAM-5 [Caenorhabditis briggsae]CAP27570.2 Protein CBR-RAM-5 [Caenorhabditis briggsae]
MQYSTVKVIGLVFHFVVCVVSTDFDNAHVMGVPQVTCSSKLITVTFNTNIPFQGRISVSAIGSKNSHFFKNSQVYNKLFIPACNHDYSTNIQKNATFHMDIMKCADTSFLKNGSRILKAYVEIGFHPLVMTNSDRTFLVECLDNTIMPIVNVAQSFADCTHLVRMASEWSSMTEFHVGDAIVHEWSCKLPNSAKTQTFLTNCNALSQNGQVIHLIDENGCVIDSELMGDVVYNDHVPKLYARARIFKFLTDDKYRIECTLEFCDNGSPCKERVFPPKCAFTKEEITNRSIRNQLEQSTMSGVPSIAYDSKLKVSSAWLSIKLNQYTETHGLHPRYHLKTFLDPTLHDVIPINAADHFLMGISYREPIPKLSSHHTDTHPDNNRVEGARILHSSAFQPIISPPIDSHEEFIETITFGSSLNSEPILNVQKEMHLRQEAVQKVFPHKEKEPLKTEKFMKQNKNENNKNGVLEDTTQSPLVFTTTTPSATMMVPTTTTMTSSTKSFNIHKVTELLNTKKKSFEKGNALVEMTQTTPATATAVNLKFYSTTSAKKLTPTTPYAPAESSTTPQPPNSTKSIRNVTHSVPTVKKYDKFVNNNADWRFDDKAINDSDISQRQCKWSGVEHLLLIWSFASLIVWMMLIALFLYRYSSRKPQWIGFREKELRRVTQSRVLSQDHPWLHADAFEERNQNKNEIEINHFT